MSVDITVTDRAAMLYLISSTVAGDALRKARRPGFKESTVQDLEPCVMIAQMLMWCGLTAYSGHFFRYGYAQRTSALPYPFGDCIKLHQMDALKFGDDDLRIITNHHLVRKR